MTQTWLYSTWENAPAHEKLSITIKNDDGSSRACSGSTLIDMLGPKFKTNEDGIGSVKGQYLSAKVTG